MVRRRRGGVALQKEQPMRLRVNLNCLLIKDHLSDGSTVWCSWCPEVDVFTQGDHPDHAVAMLEEATRMVIEHSINDCEPDPGEEFTCRRKRVMHPLRNGRHAHKDDNWGKFQELKEMYEKHDDFSPFPLGDFRDGLDEYILVGGNAHIETRSGVFKVDVGFDTYGFAPSEKYSVEFLQAYPRKERITLRSSVLNRGGLSNEDYKKSEVDQVMRRKTDVYGEVKVTRHEK